MMKLNGEALQEKAFRQIEAAAAAELAELSAAIAQLDPCQREAVSNAALHLAGTWADAALWLGWQMRGDPGKWLFVTDGNT